MAAQLQSNRGRVFVTQVVPPPDNLKSPLVVNYRKALKAVDAKAKPGFYFVGGLCGWSARGCGFEEGRC